jgi:hypothetical protein
MASVSQGCSPAIIKNQPADSAANLFLYSWNIVPYYHWESGPVTLGIIWYGLSNDRSLIYRFDLPDTKDLLVRWIDSMRYPG